VSAESQPASDQELRRSVGVLSLFATAYGNVGSSIYYALGLVAAHALGLTPLVFLFADGLFLLNVIYRRHIGVDPRLLHRRGLECPDHLPRFTRERRLRVRRS